MEQLIISLWQHADKLGAAGSFVLALWVIYLLREIRAVRAELFRCQEERIKDNKAMYEIVERNTAAAASQTEVLRVLATKK